MGGPMFPGFDWMKRITRVRVLLIGVLAISTIALVSLRHVREVGADDGPTIRGNSRTPVLIELFTSEGCSSCPPADELLQKLDRSQPVSGAEAIVLSEHVDYWNDIGWTDPYSSHEYSERQDAYARRFRLDTVYTPQMVVDGRVELVGSNERRALQAIENASKTEKAEVKLSPARVAGDKQISVHVEAGPLPASSGASGADVFLATADESDESHVARGENAGRTLTHVAVLRHLERVGSVSGTKGFSQDVKLRLDPAAARNLRIVAIVQESPTGRVWGVGEARLSN